MFSLSEMKASIYRGRCRSRDRIFFLSEVLGRSGNKCGLASIFHFPHERIGQQSKTLVIREPVVIIEVIRTRSDKYVLIVLIPVVSNSDIERSS